MSLTNAEEITGEIFIPSARAKRRLGTFFDEFSRGMNPFGLIPTFGVADANTPVAEIVRLFDKFNIVKVRGVYSAKESAELQRLCILASKLKPLDYLKIFKGEGRGFTGGSPVLNNKNFWPYAANKHVREIVQKILGKNATEFGSSVAAHYSARGIHRDYRQLCEKAGSAYHVSNPQKRIVRVLHYCASENMQGGMLGVIPFSHDERLFAEQSKRVGNKRPIEWFDTHRDELAKLRTTKDFSVVDEIDRHIVWVATDPGDVLITNSAMLHCGEHMMSPRYFFVSTYTDVNSETLPMAAAQVKSETAKEYHRHLLSLGFGGSKALLKEVEKK
ncbi:hypothetical protein [Sinorhizobium sp. 22678]|uniref:hypothetical protein n=1 Tax=Sinorhizobium sp. 22678 TaxID=3453955 RepID=UPI003F85630E